jgi:hypothetical protein
MAALQRFQSSSVAPGGGGAGEQAAAHAAGAAARGAAGELDASGERHAVESAQPRGRGAARLAAIDLMRGFIGA